jgi:hypothetical protein
MKIILVIALAAIVMLSPVSADARGGGSHNGTSTSHSHSGLTGEHYVKPHVTKKGTYVKGHMQTNPNGTKLDNWSTKGNVNPYTGKPGTKNP